MLRKLLILLVSVLTTVGMTIFSAGSASALGGETMGCLITGGPAYYYNPCVGGTSSGSVTIDYLVMDETAPSTYSWAVPSVYLSKITDGCTSTTNYCQLTVGRGGKEITVSVTLSQGGATATLSATASIEPMCGNQWC
jgi:hypothetical protein